MTAARTILLADDLSMVDGRYRSGFGPDRYAHGLGRLLSDASARLCSGGVLLLTGAALRHLGFPKAAPAPRVKTSHATLAHAEQEGWLTSDGRLRPWIRFYRKDHVLVVGILDWMTADRMPLLQLWPEETGELLHMWQRLMGGVPYWGTPGVAGTALLRALWDGKRDEPKWQPTPPRGLDYVIERDFTWSHPVDPPRAYGVHRHTFDVNAMYLAAESAAHLPVGRLEHRTGAGLELDRSRSGLHLIEAERWTEHRIPDPAAWGSPAGPSRMWVATPTLVLLDDLERHGHHGGYVIREEWTAPAHRLMRGWAEQVRDAVYPKSPDVPEPIRAAAKAVYRETWGMLARPGGRIYRPDWSSIILAHARCTLWRKLWAVGRRDDMWPVDIATDAVSYYSTEPDAERAIPQGWEIGTGLGKWKVKP